MLCLNANESEKYQRIVEQINSLKGITLAEFQGRTKLTDDPIEFPEYGATDADIFENNLLEVMQFVFNHTTFETSNELDKAVLAAFKPLGIEPGKIYDQESAVKIDGKHFREVSLVIKDAELAKMDDPAVSKVLLPNLFVKRLHDS